MIIPIRKYISFFALACVLAACQGSAATRPLSRLEPVGAFAPTAETGPTCSAVPTSGCTVFTIAKGDQVFFGGNDDTINPDSYYWVDPGDAENYGVIWIGMPDNVQQGINEKGLAYDANGLPRVDTNPHPERKPVSGDYSSYPIHILHECATVEEVIEWVNNHQWHAYMHDQLQFADASGDAVIISAGSDGELVFTRKPPGDGFLVSTNFNVANPSNGNYPCQRYATASERLSRLVGQVGQLTFQEISAVLDAVHTEGGSSWTIESLAADLTNGMVYLYFYHQFDQPLVLNVAEEIANPRAPGALSRLFPEQVQQEAARRYRLASTNQGRCDRVGKIWIGLVLAGLVLLVVFSIRNPRGWRFWLPVMIILGPLGLLSWLIAGRKRQASAWQIALVEATGDVLPAAAAFLFILAVFFLVPRAQASQLIQILFVFVLPLLLGLLLFQGPLLAQAARQGYLRTLVQRLPAAWVATNLGIGGINTLAIPLVNWISKTCSLMPLSPWILVSLWAVVAAGASLAMLPLLVFEGWAVGRGSRAWHVLAFGSGRVKTPGWRKLWWWLLLSFAVLLGGIIASQLLQQMI